MENDVSMKRHCMYDNDHCFGFVTYGGAQYECDRDNCETCEIKNLPVPVTTGICDPCFKKHHPDVVALDKNRKDNVYRCDPIPK